MQRTNQYSTDKLKLITFHNGSGSVINHFSDKTGLSANWNMHIFTTFCGCWNVYYQLTTPMPVQFLHVLHNIDKFKENWEFNFKMHFKITIDTISHSMSVNLLTVVPFHFPSPNCLNLAVPAPIVCLKFETPADRMETTAPETRVDIVYTWLNEDTVCRRKSRLQCGGRQWGSRYRFGRCPLRVSQVSVPFKRRKIIFFMVQHWPNCPLWQNFSLSSISTPLF